MAAHAQTLTKLARHPGCTVDCYGVVSSSNHLGNPTSVQRLVDTVASDRVHSDGECLFASLARGGYAPGVITSVLINIPFGVYVLRRAVKKQWIRARVAWQLIGTAVVFHGVLLGSLMAG